MKTLFIYNPNAGKMQIKNKLYDILNVFAKANYDLTVFPTKKSGEAISYIKKNTKNFDLIICSGGDGTLNETINGLLSSRLDKLPPLGYIPAGSTNDFANSIKLPKNMVNAAELITNGILREFDIGKFNSNYFVYVAAFGVFTSVTYTTPQDMKNNLGHFAYLLEGLKSLTTIKSYKLKIKSKDIKLEGDFIYGMITNTYSVGGLYQLDKKQVSLNDGLFEVTLIRQPKDPIDLAEINAYLVDNSMKTDMVISFKTSKLVIETEDDMPWTLDGEYGGNPKKATISVLSKKIKIINKK